MRCLAPWGSSRHRLGCSARRRTTSQSGHRRAQCGNRPGRDHAVIDLKLREEALTIWDAARATLESGDRSDLARLQIEEAFDLYEAALSRAAPTLMRMNEDGTTSLVRCENCAR